MASHRRPSSGPAAPAALDGEEAGVATGAAGGGDDPPRSKPQPAALWRIAGSATKRDDAYVPVAVVRGPLQPFLVGGASGKVDVEVEVAVVDEPASPHRKLVLRLCESRRGIFFASGLQAWLVERGACPGDHMRLHRLPGGRLGLSLIPAAGGGPGEAEGRRQPVGSAGDAAASARLPAVGPAHEHASGPATSRPQRSSEGCDGNGRCSSGEAGGGKGTDVRGGRHKGVRGRGRGAACPGGGLGPEAAPLPHAPAPAGLARRGTGSRGRQQREGGAGGEGALGAGAGPAPGIPAAIEVPWCGRLAILRPEEARMLFPGIDTSNTSGVKTSTPFRLEYDSTAGRGTGTRAACAGKATLASHGSTLQLWLQPASAVGDTTLLRLWREGGTLVVARAGQHGEAGAGGAAAGAAAEVSSAIWAVTASALQTAQLQLPRAVTKGPLKPLLAGAQGPVVVDVLATEAGWSAGQRLRLVACRYKYGYRATGLGPWLRERGAAAGDSLRLARLADGGLSLSLTTADRALADGPTLASAESGGMAPAPGEAGNRAAPAAGTGQAQDGMEVILAGIGSAALQPNQAQELLSAEDASAAKAALLAGTVYKRRLKCRLVGAAAAAGAGERSAPRQPLHEVTLALKQGNLRLHFKQHTLRALGQPAALRLRREGGAGPLVVEPAALYGGAPPGEARVVWPLAATVLTTGMLQLPTAAVAGPLQPFLPGDSRVAVKVDVQVADEPGRVLTVRIHQRGDARGYYASGVLRWLRERGAAVGDRLRLSLLADGSLELSLLRQAAGPQQPAAAGGAVPRTASEAAPRKGQPPAPSTAAVSGGKRRREEGDAKGVAAGDRAQDSRVALAAVHGGDAGVAHPPSACVAAPLLRKRVALSPAQAQALGLRGPGGAYAQGPLPLRVAGGEAGPSAGGCPGAAHTVTLEEREGALVLRLGRRARKALGGASALWLWREGGGLAASPAPASEAGAGEVEVEARRRPALEPREQGLDAALTGPGEGGNGDPKPGQGIAAAPTGEGGIGGQAPASQPEQDQARAAEPGPQGGGQPLGSGSGSGPPSATWPLDQASLDHRPFLPAPVTLGPLQPLLHGRPSARVHVAVADQPGRPLALRVKQEAGTGRYWARGLRGWLRERGARARDLLTLTRLPEGGLVLRLDHQAGTAQGAAPEPATAAQEPGAQGRGAAPSDANAPSFADLAAQLPTCGKRPPEGGAAGQAEAKRARQDKKGGARAKGRRSPAQPQPVGESPSLLPAPSLSAVHLRPHPLPPSAPAAPPALQPGELRLCGLTFHPALAPAVRRSLAAWEAALCEQLRGEGLDGGLSDAAPEALQVCVLDGARLREAGIREYVVRCQLAHLLGLADAFDKDLPPHAPQLGPDRLAPGPDAGRGGAGLFAAAGLRKGAVLGVLGGYVMPGAEARRFAARGWQALGAEARVELGARAGGGAAASEGGTGQHVRSAWQLLEGSMRLPMPGSPDGWQLSMLGYGSLAALINDPRRQPRGWLEGSDVGDEGGAAARAANSTVVPVSVRGLALPVVVAVRDVAPGEQLLRDYGAEWWREREEAWWCVEEMGAVRGE